MKSAPPLEDETPDGDTVFICFQPTLGAYWPEGATEPTDLDVREAKSLLGIEGVDAERAATHAETASSN